MGLSGTSFRHLEIGIGSLGAARDIEALGASLGAQTFFVSSGTGGAGNDGKSWREPKATLDTAMALCTASQGDIVYLMPGHVEDSAAAATWDIDVAGVSVIGLGHGTARPRFDFNATASILSISASGCILSNVQLRPSIASVVVGIDVEASVTDTLLEDIEVLPGEEGDGTDDFIEAIQINAGCTRTTVSGYKYRQHASSTAPVSALVLEGTSDDILIENMDAHMLGAALTACIDGLTGASTKVRIRDCVFVTDAAEPGISLLTGTTGVAIDVLVFSNMANLVDAIVGDALARFRCENIEVAAESGGVIGTPSIND